MARVSLFLGKGGTGKTTLATAYAAHCALRRANPHVLLISTDPAHSIGDVLQIKLADRRVRVKLPRAGTLFAWEVDAKREFDKFLTSNRNALLSILERGSLFTREDIEPLLDISLPGMAEMSALLALHDALKSKKYEHIILDTAPLGHTLRLLELPEYFQRFLSFLELASDRDRVLAEHFGGRAQRSGSSLVDEWRRLASSLSQALRGADLFLVTTPEKFALNESVRARTLLHTHSPPLKIAAIVLNRARLAQADCATCRQRIRATQAAKKMLAREFSEAQLYISEDIGAPIAGIRALAAWGDHVFAGRPFKEKTRPPASVEVRLRQTKWPVLATPLSLVLGKGGVGKTTISAGLGFHTRSHSKVSVEICSVDPAPSLDDVFQTEVDEEPRPVLGDAKFRASEMDAVALFKSWVEDVKAAIEDATSTQRSGIHLDLWFERQLFSQLLEIVPPGIDEVLAIVRISELLAHSSKRVVIDMAPTGHAIDLLRTPERILAWTRLLLKTLAAHRTLGFARDAGVKVAEFGQRVRELLELLKDPAKTAIFAVMLPEPLPDRETERLLGGLENLGLVSKCIFVNRVLMPGQAGNCRTCRQARRWQMATLARLSRRYPEKTIYAVRNFPNEIAGKRLLRSLTGELWRIN